MLRGRKLTQLALVRHVKCDEARPACKNCTSTGRTCDGYATSNSATFEKPSSIILHEPINRDLSLYAEASPRETRAFFFYFHQTGPQFSVGFDDSQFWEQLVPQSAFVKQGIWHALTALASCHEDFQKRDRGNVQNRRFTLCQYNKAISKFVSSEEGPYQADPDVYHLLSCLIFICIEVCVYKVSMTV